MSDLIAGRDVAPISEVIEILANSAHDLRGTLNPLIGFAEFLHDGKAGSLSRQQKEYLADIVGAGRSQLQLIDDLIQLVRIEAGRVEVQPVSFELKEALEEVRAVLASGAAGAAVRLFVDSQHATVCLDRDKLIRIVRSLAANTVQLAAENGEVRIALRAEAGRRVVLDVLGCRQHGSREPDDFPAAAGHLDERLVRTGNPAYLNLAATRKLVELLGGSLKFACSADLLVMRCTADLPMFSQPGAQISSASA